MLSRRRFLFACYAGAMLIQACGPPKPLEGISEFKRIYAAEGRWLQVGSLRFAMITDMNVVEAHRAISDWASQHIPENSEISFEAAKNLQNLIDRTLPMSQMVFMNHFKSIQGEDGYIDRSEYAPGKYKGEGIFCFPHSSRHASPLNWKTVFADDNGRVFVIVDRRSCWTKERVMRLKQELPEIIESSVE